MGPVSLLQPLEQRHGPCEERPLPLPGAASLPGRRAVTARELRITRFRGGERVSTAPGRRPAGLVSCAAEPRIADYRSEATRPELGSVGPKPQAGPPPGCQLATTGAGSLVARCAPPEPRVASYRRGIAGCRFETRFAGPGLQARNRGSRVAGSRRGSRVRVQARNRGFRFAGLRVAGSKPRVSGCRFETRLAGSDSQGSGRRFETGLREATDSGRYWAVTANRAADFELTNYAVT
jgi:hypothetical protein